MSNLSDRLAAIKQNYDDASDNEATDLASAKTAAEVAAVQANVANARSTYFSAVEAMLSKAGDDVEAAYQEALNSQKIIADARKKSAAIADFLGKLSDGTDKATTLLNKAKSL